MLGNVLPRDIRVTSQPVVYTSRDNTSSLTMETLSGRRWAALDLSAVTRWVLLLPAIAARFDSLEVPGVFVVSGGTLTLDLDGYAIPSSGQPCVLVAYDAEHPNGQVLIDNDDCVVVIEFSSVAAAGSLPLPATPLDALVVFTAGDTLSGHRAAYSDGVVVRYASADDLSSAERCVGITTQSAVTGSTVLVRRSGLLVEPTWSWAPGPVFLGLTGALTQVPPTSGVSLQVGVALDATTLDVRVDTPIILD